MPKIATADDEAFATAREVLNHLMTVREVTEAELGEALGLAQNTISDRCRGRSNLNLADIRRAAMFFGVSPEIFFSSLSASSESAIAA